MKYRWHHAALRHFTGQETAHTAALLPLRPPSPALSFLALFPSQKTGRRSKTPPVSVTGSMESARFFSQLHHSLQHSTGRAARSLATCFRTAFFRSFNLPEAAGAFLEQAGIRSHAHAIRLFFMSDDPQIKSTFASWNHPSIANPSAFHEIFRQQVDRKTPAAILNRQSEPPLPEDCGGLYFTFKQHSVQFFVLIAVKEPATLTARTIRIFFQALAKIPEFLRETVTLGGKLQHLSHLKEIEQLTLDLMTVQDLREFHQHLAEKLRQYLNVEHTAYYFLDRESGKFTRFDYAGKTINSAAPWESRNRQEQSLLGECIRGGNVLLKAEVPAVDSSKMIDGQEFRSVLYYPVKEGREVIGVIKAAGSQPGMLTFSHLQRLQPLEPWLVKATVNNRAYSQLMSKLYLDNETGLYNRRGFELRVQEKLFDAQHSGTIFSIMMASIDRPDNLQLENNPQLAKQFPQQLAMFFRRILPPGSVLAHLGDFSFVFLLPGLDLDQSLQLSRNVCARIREDTWKAWNRPTLSIGVSSFPLNGLGMDELILSAEQAMTISRFQGGDTASILGSKVLQKLAVNIFTGFIGIPHFQTGPEMVDGVLQRITNETLRDQGLSMVEMINSLAEAIDAKDHYTGSHTLETSIYSVILGRKAGLDEKSLENLRIAAKLHDIGKIGIPESILLKRGRLNRREQDIMRRHPDIGAKILRPIASLRNIAVIVEHHHERWDGTGYPHQLKGEEIPVESRILAIIDSYHAMISRRAYRNECTPDFALKEIRKGAGTQFDPQLTALFAGMMHERMSFGDSLTPGEELTSPNMTTH